MGVRYSKTEVASLRQSFKALQDGARDDAVSAGLTTLQVEMMPCGNVVFCHYQNSMIFEVLNSGQFGYLWTNCRDGQIGGVTVA